MNINKININQTEPSYYIASDIYDVSARNNGATFESLSALLSNENLSTLIPTEIRCGGMTIRFVQSSDNKYVQYRLMSSEWSLTESDWLGVDDEPTADSDNLVKSGGVFSSISAETSRATAAEEANQQAIAEENQEIKTIKTELYRDISPLSEYQTGIGYIKKSLGIQKDKSFRYNYYQVELGKTYMIKGFTTTNSSIVNVALAEDINIITSSLIGSIGSNVVVEQAITIENPIKYIVISFSYSNQKLFIYENNNDNINSRLDIHDNEIENTKKLILKKEETQLVVDETIEGFYYTNYGDFGPNSVLSLDYYAVLEGQQIHLTGSATGIISLFVLLTDKNEQAKISYGRCSSISDTVTLDEIITIPKGINWLARSYKKSHTTVPYLLKFNNRLDLLDNRIDNLVNSLNPSKYKGKRLLAIGDSITAGLVYNWQYVVGELLEMNVRTHAKGGIGIIQMVDGDGSGDAPEGYDPDNFGVSSIYRLNTEDVTNVDIIVLMGFYNTRKTALNTKGEISDMYPEQNTWYGQMNYAVKRVYEELENAGNTNCKVVLCSAHKYGKYAYSDVTAYEDGDVLAEATKDISNRHSLFFIDLMHNGNINMYNWNEFQNSNSQYNSKYIPSDGVNDGTNKPFDSLDVAPSATENEGKYITILNKAHAFKSDGSNWIWQNNYPCPWNGDQLHLNSKGHVRIGEYIAAQLLSM